VVQAVDVPKMDFEIGRKGVVVHGGTSRAGVLVFRALTARKPTSLLGASDTPVSAERESTDKPTVSVVGS
jgi:hypothetical protein